MWSACVQWIMQWMACSGSCSGSRAVAHAVVIPSECVQLIACSEIRSGLCALDTCSEMGSEMHSGLRAVVMWRLEWRLTLTVSAAAKRL